ncbi:MAG TPA: methyl-accepting chemotaxis protein [Ensifer sp.]|nr:methyl-accepting chemotaxis protein [Ensifer sp.]
MSLLSRVSIKAKILSIVFPLALVALTGLGALSYLFKDTSRQYSDFMATENVATVDIARSGSSMTGVPYAAYQMLVYDNTVPRYADLRSFYETNKAEVLDRLDQAAVLSPANAAMLKELSTRARLLFQSTDTAIKLDADGKSADAAKVLAEADPAFQKWRSDAGELNDARLKALLKTSDDLADLASTSVIGSVAAVGIAFLIGLVAAFYVSTRGITGPIARLRDRMTSLASGDTSSKIEGLERKDEIGAMAKVLLVFQESAIERLRLEVETEANRSMSEKERIERETQKAREAADVQFAVDNLAAALAKLSDGDVAYRIREPFVASLDAVRSDFNSSADKLQAALRSVSDNACVIDAGSSKIKATADDLAKRTEQQAAAVEETAAALEQITITVRDSTRRAQEAGQLVSHTKAGAEQSGQVVSQAVVAMEMISKSANEISNIIGVIDEIAFQTNLLALNAGVEAARAGDAGKGFAVVAQEVRELAQRSAKAAKEIKTLITTSNTQVEQGVKLVGETGRALETIVAEVQEIDRHVLAIVESAQEQATGLAQINTAVNQMDQDTQKNAAMVEESTAASHSLASEVVSLNRLLAQFKLAEGGVATHSQPRGAVASDQPSASPAKALGRRIASAFAGNAAVDTASDWQEF